jgi:hypothetical protein
MVRNIQDNYEYKYVIVDTSGNPVTGQTITLRIQKQSNGYWYDFSDNTFKASGWTSPTSNLSYDTTGEFYYYLYNPPASEAASELYSFIVDNASATYGDHQAYDVAYQNIGTSTFSSASNTVTLASGTHTGAIIPTVTAVTNDVGITQAGADKVWATTARALTDKVGFGINWAAITNPSTTVNLSGTTISTGQAVASVSGSVNSVTTGVSLSAAAIDLIWEELQSGHTTPGSFGYNLDSRVSQVSPSAIADSVWDEVLSGHVGAGSTGYALNAAGAAGDPWSTTLPGPYSAGSAGYILGTNLNAAITSRSTLTAPEVWADSVRSLTDKAGFALSATAIDNIWDEPKAGHLTSGTFGYFLDAQVSRVGALTVQDIVDGIWNESILTHLAADTMGARVNDAGTASNPWATDISTGYTGQAGEYVRDMYKNTNGVKDGGVYNGIENLIRANR